MAEEKKLITIKRPCIVKEEGKDPKSAKIGEKFTLPLSDANYLIALNKAVAGDQKIEAPPAKAKKEPEKK